MAPPQPLATPFVADFLPNNNFRMSNVTTPAGCNPAIAGLKGALYVFFTGSKNEGVYWTANSFANGNTQSWSPPLVCGTDGTSSVSSPSAVNLTDDSIFIFFQQSNSPYIWYYTFDGTNFSTAVTVSSDATPASGTSPVAKVYNGEIYVFHVGSAGDGIWYNIWNGNKFGPKIHCDAQGLDIAPGTSPAVLEYDGTILLFCSGNNNTEDMWLTTFDGNAWGPVGGLQSQTGCSLRPGTSPSAFRVDSGNDMLVVMWNDGGGDGTSLATWGPGAQWTKQESFSDQVGGDGLSNSATAQGFCYYNDNISYRPIILWTASNNSVNMCVGLG